MGARDIKKGGIIYRLYKELLKISKRNAKFLIKKKERKNKTGQYREKNADWLNLISNWRIIN